MTIDRILELAQHDNASDIHISPGNPVMLRIDGKLVPQTNDLFHYREKAFNAKVALNKQALD